MILSCHRESTRMLECNAAVHFMGGHVSACVHKWGYIPHRCALTLAVNCEASLCSYNGTAGLVHKVHAQPTTAQHSSLETQSLSMFLYVVVLSNNGCAQLEQLSAHASTADALYLLSDPPVWCYLYAIVKCPRCNVLMHFNASFSCGYVHHCRQRPTSNHSMLCKCVAAHTKCPQGYLWFEVVHPTVPRASYFVFKCIDSTLLIVMHTFIIAKMCHLLQRHS